VIEADDGLPTCLVVAALALRAELAAVFVEMATRTRIVRDALKFHELIVFVSRTCIGHLRMATSTSCLSMRTVKRKVAVGVVKQRSRFPGIGRVTLLTI